MRLYGEKTASPAECHPAKTMTANETVESAVRDSHRKGRAPSASHAAGFIPANVSAVMAAIPMSDPRRSAVYADSVGTRLNAHPTALPANTKTAMIATIKERKISTLIVSSQLS